MSDVPLRALEMRRQGIDKHLSLLVEKIKEIEPDLIQYERLIQERASVDRQISDRKVNEL